MRLATDSNDLGRPQLLSTAMFIVILQVTAIAFFNKFSYHLSVQIPPTTALHKSWTSFWNENFVTWRSRQMCNTRMSFGIIVLVVGMLGANPQSTQGRQNCDPLESAKLLASDGAEGDRRGASVAISETTMVVGASKDDDGGGNSGSVFIFKFDGANWVEETILIASDARDQEYFGSTVAISGNVLVVGAPYDDDNGEYSGSAYIFRYDGNQWIEEVKLLASDGSADERFGISVAVFDDIAVIGTMDYDQIWDREGKAYVFRYDGKSWFEEAKLQATDGEIDDLFGSSVAVSEDTILIGAQLDDNQGNSSGSAYIFRNRENQWLEEAKLLPSDGSTNDVFGQAVAIMGDTAFIGAPLYDTDKENAGVT